MENLFLEIPEDEMSLSGVAVENDLGDDIFDTSYLLGLTKQTHEQANAEKYVLFKIDGRLYAAELKSVVEVCRQLAITAVPNVPGWLVGIANLRGDLLSILDVRAFDTKSALTVEPRSKIVVVIDRQTGISVGLLVDQIMEIVSLPPEKITAAELPGKGPLQGFITKTSQHNGSQLMLLDIKKLLASPLLQDLQN
jgi:purine-binding chemotaxis protein CheW